MNAQMKIELMTSNTVLKTGALLAAFAVIIGAFGAHGLGDLLVDNGREATFETAVKYHFYHSFSLLIVGLLMKSMDTKYFIWSARLFALGILVFSGSLYILSITNMTILGAITPIGGVLFILGWLTFYRGIQSS